MKSTLATLLVGAAVLAAPLIVFGAEDAAKKEAKKTAPSPGAESKADAEKALSPDALRESLLKSLRPGNLTREELDRLQQEMRVMFEPGIQFKDLSTLEIIRLLDRVMSETEAGPGRVTGPNGGRRPGSRMDPDRRGMRGGPPGGRRGGLRFGGGRPDIVNGGRGGQMVQLNSPIFEALFEEESGQDPEHVADVFEDLIQRFDDQRRNMATVHYRLGRLKEKLNHKAAAAEQYRLILSRYSDIAEIKADAEKALKELNAAK